MDMQKLYVVDNGGLRRLSLREGLRICGYPDDIKFDVSEKMVSTYWETQLLSL